MSLDIIDKGKYFQFAKAHFQKNNFTIKEECFNAIYSQFEGHTWYIQVVLNRLFEYRKEIDNLDIVFYAIKELLEGNTYSYQELLNAYSDVQVKLLQAIAKEKIIKQINSGDFISKSLLSDKNTWIKRGYFP